jgi:hypothetical protein
VFIKKRLNFEALSKGWRGVIDKRSLERDGIEGETPV